MMAYRAYVRRLLGTLQVQLATLSARLRAGDVAGAESAWLAAHLSWLRDRPGRRRLRRVRRHRPPDRRHRRGAGGRHRRPGVHRLSQGGARPVDATTTSAPRPPTPRSLARLVGRLAARKLGRRAADDTRRASPPGRCAPTRSSRTPCATRSAATTSTGAGPRWRRSPQTWRPRGRCSRCWRRSSTRARRGWWAGRAASWWRWTAPRRPPASAGEWVAVAACHGRRASASTPPSARCWRPSRPIPDVLQVAGWHVSLDRRQFLRALRGRGSVRGRAGRRRRAAADGRRRRRRAARGSAGAQTARSQRDAVADPAARLAAVPFHGEHQAGIVSRPAPGRLLCLLRRGGRGPRRAARAVARR